MRVKKISKLPFSWFNYITDMGSVPLSNLTKIKTLYIQDTARLTNQCTQTITIYIEMKIWAWLKTRNMGRLLSVCLSFHSFFPNSSISILLFKQGRGNGVENWQEKDHTTKTFSLASYWMREREKRMWKIYSCFTELPPRWLSHCRKDRL